MDGRQHHNLEASRLVRRRGHLRSREDRGRETACLVVGVGRVLAGNNLKPSKTAPIPCQRDIGGTANRIKQMSTSLGRLGILLVETAVLTSSAADSSNTQKNTVVLSVEAREYIDVYLPVAALPSNVPPVRFLVLVPRPDTRPLIGSLSSRRPPKHHGRYHHVPCITRTEERLVPVLFRLPPSAVVQVTSPQLVLLYQTLLSSHLSSL